MAMPLIRLHHGIITLLIPLALGLLMAVLLPLALTHLDKFLHKYRVIPRPLPHLDRIFRAVVMDAIPILSIGAPLQVNNLPLTFSFIRLHH